MLNHPTATSTKRTWSARLGRISDKTDREERLQLVVDELTHRNKNLLALVQAIASQTGKRSAGLNHFQAQFTQRLQGLSRSIDLLVREDLRAASIADLVRSQLEPFGEVTLGEVSEVRIAATGPDVLLNREAVQNIGLALHELATNATKYGALSVPEGKVTLAWALGSDDFAPARFRLIWREYNGPSVVPPTHRGFGQIVLQCLTSEALKGKVNHTFKAGGVSWTLEAPAAAVLDREQKGSGCEAGPGIAAKSALSLTGVGASLLQAASRITAGRVAPGKAQQRAPA